MKKIRNNSKFLGVNFPCLIGVGGGLYWKTLVGISLWLKIKIEIEILEKYLVDEGHDYKIIGTEIHKPVKDKTSKSIQNLKKADIRYSKTFPIFLALSKYDHSYNPCHFRRF